MYETTQTESPEISSLTRNIQSSSFDNPASVVFTDEIDSSGIVFDSKGNMYATDRYTHDIKVYDSSGNMFKTIGGKNLITPVSFEFLGFVDIPDLSSLFIQYAHAVDNVLYCHISTGKGCIDPDGIGPLDVGDGQFYFPRGIAIDSNDNIYVIDFLNSRIQVFDSNGNFITKFGTHGIQNGQFRSPEGITVNSSGNIYVTEAGRIQVFDSNGNFITKFGTHGYDDGQFYYPHGITVNSSGNIYVADTGNYRIQVFDSNGNFITKFGAPGFDNHDGRYDYPHGIAMDSNDNIYVTDENNHNIQVFDSNGNFITKFGTHGIQNGQFRSPSGITIDENDNIYVTERDNDRIQKISFEEVIISFSEQFDKIRCDANSMINDPIKVPVGIARTLPVSELLPRAENLANTKQFDESLLMYYIISQIEPNNKHAWNGIGYTLTFLCDNNSSINAYHHSLKLNENNINALNGLGFFYTNQLVIQSQKNASKDMDATANLAISNYEKVPSYQTNVNSLNGLGTIYALLEQYDKAIEHFGKALDLNTDRVVTLNGMANAQLRSGNLILATSYYDKALNIEKNNFDALLGLLSIYIQQDNDVKEREITSKLGQSITPIVKSLIEEGKWFAERGQNEEAQKFFGKADELNPDNKQAQKLLGGIVPQISK